MSTPQENIRTVLRHLLDGKPPNGHANLDCGNYNWIRDAALQARDVRKWWQGLVKAQPAVAVLLASEDPLEDLGIFTAADLMQMDLPEPQYIVDGVLPEGASLLVAKPKRGKSLLMQHLAVAIATGGKALGRIDVQRGRVLYLMLEGSKRGLKRRFSLMQPIGKMPENLHIAQAWPSVDEGGIDLLRKYVDRYPDTRLIVVDTFKGIRGQQDARRSLYDVDYESLHPFSELYEETGVSSVNIHHANKRGDDADVIDQVSGSTGLSAAVENIMALVQDGSQTVLKVLSREEEAVELALRLDAEIATWVLLGNADEVAKTEERNQVLQVLREADQAMRAKEIADILGEKSNTVTKLLHKMRKAGKVTQPKYGFWEISPLTPSHTDQTGHTEGEDKEGV